MLQSSYTTYVIIGMREIKVQFSPSYCYNKYLNKSLYNPVNDSHLFL